MTTVLRLPGPGMAMPSKVRTRWPAGVMRVTCNGRSNIDLAYLPEPSVVAIEFTGATQATVECGIDLDGLRKSDLVEIATAMGIDHAGRKSDLIDRIRGA